MISGRLGLGIVAALAVGGCKAKVEPQRRQPTVATPAPEPAVGAAEPVPPAKAGPKPGPDEPGYSPEMTTGKYDVERYKAPEYLDIEPHHQPPLLAGVMYAEGQRGEPSVVGCADGQREGFAAVSEYPSIAGCIGDWKGSKSLVTPATGSPCGDDLGDCNEPADVCATGWHVCGSPEGQVRDLTSRVKPDDCDAAGPGRFNAAFSHNYGDHIDGCLNDDHYRCKHYGFGAEPVCCGSDCEFGLCRDGVWEGRTRISRGLADGCGLLDSARNGGVLCCTDVEL